MQHLKEPTGWLLNTLSTTSSYPPTLYSVLLSVVADRLSWLDTINTSRSRGWQTDRKTRKPTNWWRCAKSFMQLLEMLVCRVFFQLFYFMILRNHEKIINLPASAVLDEIEISHLCDE